MKMTFLFALFIVGCSTSPIKKTETVMVKEDKELKEREITSPDEVQGFLAASVEEVIDYKFFKIVYDSKLRIAKYVSYTLTAENLKKKPIKRKDRFRVDPHLVNKGIPAVKPSEYLNTGYDKGHLAPSADFAWSAEANDLTFVMSNMAPQKPGLNRDAWKRLENKVRRWACGEKKISVITGPVIVDGLSLLKSGLVIPNDFFKIIIDETPPRKILTFIYNQNDKGDVLIKRIVSLSKIKNVTKYNFAEFVKAFDDKESRSPASIKSWKEADCSKK